MVRTVIGRVSESYFGHNRTAPCLHGEGGFCGGDIGAPDGARGRARACGMQRSERSLFDRLCASPSRDRDRAIDLSSGAAGALDMQRAGVAPVRMEVIR